MFVGIATDYCLCAGVRAEGNKQEGEEIWLHCIVLLCLKNTNAVIGGCGALPIRFIFLNLCTTAGNNTNSGPKTNE